MTVLVACASRHGATEGIAERIARTLQRSGFEAIHPCDERIYFGAHDPRAKPIGLLARLGAPFMRMSTVRASIPAGDFRDWPAIEAWAEGIARELLSAPTVTVATA